jgi:hypothetical protein
MGNGILSVKNKLQIKLNLKKKKRRVGEKLVVLGKVMGGARYRKWGLL